MRPVDPDYRCVKRRPINGEIFLGRLDRAVAEAPFHSPEIVSAQLIERHRPRFPETVRRQSRRIGAQPKQGLFDDPLGGGSNKGRTGAVGSPSAGEQRILRVKRYAARALREVVFERTSKFRAGGDPCAPCHHCSFFGNVAAAQPAREPVPGGKRRES